MTEHVKERYFKAVEKTQEYWSKTMEVTLPLDTMTTEEKIRTMETLWDDLCRKAENISSPPWHKEILDEREEGIKNGKYKFMDWDDARKEILKSIK